MYCEQGCFDDGVELTLANGDEGQVLLSWSGGAAPFDVYRATSAPTIAAPTNLLLNTSAVQSTDTPPGALVFHRGAGRDLLPEEALSDQHGLRAGDRGRLS